MLKDIQDNRIVRDVGDPWNRRPAFTVEDGEECGVLYVPNRRGSWNAKAFARVDDAAVWLQKRGAAAATR